MNDSLCKYKGQQYCKRFCVSRKSIAVINRRQQSLIILRSYREETLCLYAGTKPCAGRNSTRSLRYKTLRVNYENVKLIDFTSQGTNKFTFSTVLV